MDVEQGLVAAIIADPDAMEPRLIYADWLQSIGDPLGELVVLACRGEHMWDRIRDLQIQVGGGVGISIRDALYRWHLGFVDELRLARRTLNAIHAKPAIFRHRALQFVRHLVVFNDNHLWKPLELWPTRTRVPQLTFGNEHRDILGNAMAEIPRALPGVVNLELIVAGGVLDLAPLHALRLERLALRNAAPEVIAQALAAGPPVRHVVLDVLTEELCTSDALAAVRHLQILPVPAHTALEMLVATGRLRTIEELTLNFSIVDDSFRAWLAEHRDALAHVRFHGWGHLMEPGRIVRDILRRPADAVAIYEEQQTWVAGPDHAIALARCGRLEAARERFDRAMSASDAREPEASLLEACEQLLIEGATPELLLHRGRLHLQLARPVTGLAELAPSDPARLLRGLSGQTEQLEELAHHTTCATYRALALSALGRFGEVVSSERIDPDAIVDALTRTGRDSDRLHCATIAIVEAALAGDGSLAHARATELAVRVLEPSARHLDLIATIAVRTAGCGPSLQWRLRSLHDNVCRRNTYEIANLFSAGLGD